VLLLLLSSWLHAGRRQNDYVVFNVTRVVQHSRAMTSLTRWSVAGQLTNVDAHWVYSGIVASSQPGFLKLMMSPTSPAAAAVRQYRPIYMQIDCSLLYCTVRSPPTCCTLLIVVRAAPA